MDAVIAATIAAVVGVLGTLLAPLISQHVVFRQRASETQHEVERRNFEEKRNAYTAMNRASRQFHTLLKDGLHRLRDGVYTEEDRVALEAARREYRDHYAEAQMIVPQRVLDASRAVNTVLSEADAAAKRIDRGLAPAAETADSVLLDLQEAQVRLGTMIRTMRADLGIPDE